MPWLEGWRDENGFVQSGCTSKHILISTVLEESSSLLIQMTYFFQYIFVVQNLFTKSDQYERSSKNRLVMRL